MKEVIVEDFLVRGLKVRTKNADEFDMKTAKIPALWEKLCAPEVFESIEYKNKDFKTYGVFI